MSIEERVINALSPLGLPVAPNRYDGEELAYVVFNYSEYPELYGDDYPELLRNILQVHLYLPHGWNPVQLKKRLRRELVKVCDNYPETVNASDGDSQHYVFEATVITSEVD